jgi:hypothetical protein
MLEDMDSDEMASSFSAISSLAERLLDLLTVATPKAANPANPVFGT